MNINTVFEKAANNRIKLIRGLQAEGYDHINHFGNTFVDCLAKPGGDEVILVNIDPNCARRFYKYCMDNPDNALLPRIHEVRDINDSSYMARMERLAALDHIELDARSKEMLHLLAPTFVSYIRAELDDEAMAGMEEANSSLRETARGILDISQKVYHDTGGAILPVCDIKTDNIFLRNTEGGMDFVFGDPLYPMDPRKDDNLSFMQGVYKRFGLPPLDVPAPSSAASLKMEMPS